MRTQEFIRSPLAWTGGKFTQMLAVVEAIGVPTGYYIEPFVGSCVVPMNLDLSQAKGVMLSDGCPMLVRAVNAMITMKPIDFLQELYNRSDTSKHYLKVRDLFNKGKASDADCVFLLRRSFSKMARFNKKGEFNTPPGIFTDRLINIESVRALQERVPEVMLKDFRDTVLEGSGNTYYFDPPYLGTFSGYTKEGFDESKHEELATIAKELVQSGNRVVVSNSNCEEVLSLYEGFNTLLLGGKGYLGQRGREELLLWAGPK